MSNPTITGEAGKNHSGAVPCQLSSYMDYRCKSAHSKGCVMLLDNMVSLLLLALSLMFRPAVRDGNVQLVELLTSMGLILSHI